LKPDGIKIDGQIVTVRCGPGKEATAEIRGSELGCGRAFIENGHMAYRVSKAEFGKLVEEALALLPEEFAEFLEEVPVEIRDRPTSEQMRKVGKGGLLLGLYQGRPRTQRSVEDSGTLPDVIFVFQEAIESVVDTAQELVRQVRITVLHEIGHHFGLGEEDLERLGYR
jgi:predicted Zn-dependent protease with MMP-like domain